MAHISGSGIQDDLDGDELETEETAWDNPDGPEDKDGSAVHVKFRGKSVTAAQEFAARYVQGLKVQPQCSTLQ